MITFYVNDVERLTIDEVIQKQLEMVISAKKGIFSRKKIIVLSITPRDDDLHENIRVLNRAVRSEISNFTDVIPVNSNNLQDGASYFGSKHLNRNQGVLKFAANIKRAIRETNGFVNKLRYLSNHSGAYHPIRPDDYISYPRPCYGNLVSSIPRPEDLLGKKV